MIVVRAIVFSLVEFCAFMLDKLPAEFILQRYEEGAPGTLTPRRPKRTARTAMASRANQMKVRAHYGEGLEFQRPLYPSVNQATGFFSNSFIGLLPRTHGTAWYTRNRRLS